jgi:hypothetical protein
MSLTTMWIHGNALVVEDPGEYAVIRYRGWGVELDFNSFDNEESYHNSHVPIPTPAVMDGASPMLTKITILFETTADLYIQQVDVWDGNMPVAQFHCYNAPDPPANVFTGNLSHLVPDSTNQLTLDPPYAVQYGIGVSLRCFAYGETLTLNLAAIGADFVFPNPPIIRKKATIEGSLREPRRVP